MINKLFMCSILLNKINKDLTSIIREYLLYRKEKYSNIISIKNPYESELLLQCYLFQLRRTFPQKNYYTPHNRVLLFSIDLLSIIKNEHYIFTQNEHIHKFISIFGNYLYFIFPSVN